MFDYSPTAWLNRLRDSYPGLAEQVLSGLDTGDEQALLKGLSERFEAFDLSLGAPYEATPCQCEIAPSEMRIIRTLLGSLKKFRGSVEGVDSQQLETAAIQRYVDNNAAASHNRIPLRFRDGMRRFLRHVLARYSDVDVPGRFGPGAVEEGYSQLHRWRRLFDDPNAERLYGFRAADPGELTCEYAPGRGLEPSCRLCAVPKDWNKLRLITIEPFANTYLQAYVRERIRKAWRASSPLPMDLVALGDPQRVNPQLRHANMALRGSVDGSLATLDLSDASDLISYHQVLDVMPVEVVADLDRSRTAQYITEKGADAHPVHMYAGMGNGTTFVVETMMFHAASHAIAEYYRVSPRDRRISCYGDDIICSPILAKLLLAEFPNFGWRINALKSYYDERSRFRESCGVQAYKGVDVTLLRFMGGKTGHEALVSQVDLVRRCCRWSGFYPLIKDPWEELSGIPNSPTLQAPGALLTSVPWWPDTTAPVRKRWNRELQKRQWKLPTTAQRCITVPASGLGPLYASLSGQLSGLTGSAQVRVDRHGRPVLDTRESGHLRIPLREGAVVADRWRDVYPADAQAAEVPFEGNLAACPASCWQVRSETGAPEGFSAQ